MRFGSEYQASAAWIMELGYSRVNGEVQSFTHKELEDLSGSWRALASKRADATHTQPFRAGPFYPGHRTSKTSGSPLCVIYRFGPIEASPYRDFILGEEVTQFVCQQPQIALQCEMQLPSR